MAEWKRDTDELQDLPEGIEARFDVSGRLEFFGNDQDEGDSSFLEIDWSQRVARDTTRSVVVCDDEDFESFVAYRIAEIRRKGEKQAAGGFIECGFCQKSQSEVARIIAGPTTYICDECIRLCNDILDEDGVHESS